ncbi:MAG: nucleoside triphosphate pyrophosphohydrolase [Candidatus Margulisbacteria bacterium]|jgi:tetrapyrrole methylase family protein/MazG family protein|nr:nucleoside triphosphate pyrophosphohydrolase [Candidatus Margulisiibacteriota bacterium]
MKEFSRLHGIIARLRAPDGCPWDREQTHATLKPYLLEEAYETLDALDKNDPALLCEELGDLLLQIILHSVIAEEKKEFSLSEVAQTVADKMVRRHPHVFAGAKVSGQQEIWQNWEQIKKAEKTAGPAQSILDSIPRQLPALLRAEKIQKKAARAGFDWDETEPILEKIIEEIKEFTAATASGSRAKIIDEFGDILFSLVNLARKLDIDAEDALRLAAQKFEDRFRYIEERLQTEQKGFKGCSAAELDKHWSEAKTRLPAGGA